MQSSPPSSAVPPPAHRPRRRVAVIAVGLTLIGFSLYWWYDGGRWMFFPRHFGVVETGVIYRSGRIHPRLVEAVLREHDIRVVVNLAARGPADDERTAERAAAKKLGVRLVEREGLDGGGLGDLEDYVTALTEMVAAHRSREPVLVHCAAGTQRTGAAVAWYRMLIERWTGAQAYAEYLAYRYNRPDSGKLGRYMNRHTTRLVARLIETGALERAPDRLPVFGPDGTQE